MALSLRFHVGLLTCFTNMKEWSFTRALGGREQTPTRESSRCKTPARKGVRMEVCFWGKVIIVLGNLTTVPEERGWWCTDVCGQAPHWQGRASSVGTRIQPSITGRPYVHGERPDRGGTWCNGHRCAAATREREQGFAYIKRLSSEVRKAICKH